MKSSASHLRDAKPMRIIFKNVVQKFELSNHEGYRVVISCNHDKTKTGSKAQASPRL